MVQAPLLPPRARHWQRDGRRLRHALAEATGHTLIRRLRVARVARTVATAPDATTAAESRINGHGLKRGCGRILARARCWTNIRANAVIRQPGVFTSRRLELRPCRHRVNKWLDFALKSSWPVRCKVAIVQSSNTIGRIRLGTLANGSMPSG